MDFAELSEKLKVVSTATLTSVLRNKGLYNTFMHQVAPLTPDMQMVGRAFTPALHPRARRPRRGSTGQPERRAAGRH